MKRKMKGLSQFYKTEQEKKARERQYLKRVAKTPMKLRRNEIEEFRIKGKSPRKDD